MFIPSIFIVGTVFSPAMISPPTKKNLFDKKRWVHLLILIFQKHYFCRSWHLPLREVAVVSKGQSLNHSG
jgi:hypothetical protein